MAKDIIFYSPQIRYTGGYKYRLEEDCVVELPIWPERTIETEYIRLTRAGRLTIKKGYCWDGASGPTRDTKNAMRGPLLHDALYQAEREGLLPQSYRSIADWILRKTLKMDGMSWFRRWYWFIGVRWFAAFAADPKSKREVRTAP